MNVELDIYQCSKSKCYRHSNAFLTTEYQLFYSIKVNKEYLLLEILLANTAHQLLIFPQRYKL